MSRTILMDHDDEHAPVRHEVRTEPCGQCGRAYLRGEMQQLDNGRGDRWYRCYRCRDATEARYRAEYGPEYDRLGTYQAEGR